MKVNKLRLGIFIGIVAAVIVAIILLTGKKFTLVVKEPENIVSVVSQKSTVGGKIEVSSKDLVNEIVTSIRSDRETKVKSETEVPTCEEYFTITFKNTEQKIYLYTKEDKYFIEEPHNGIYEISKEEFDHIMQYLYF